MNPYEPNPHEFTPPFNIERLEMGIWDSMDVINNLEFALMIAASYCGRMMCEHVTKAWDHDKRIRIIDNNNKII